MERSRNTPETRSRDRMPARRDQSFLTPMEQLFDPLRLFGDIFGRPLMPFERFAPIVDVEERDNEYVVCVDLPGVKKEDVNIEVAENQLSISAERRSREGREGRGSRFYGSFQRVFTLPPGTDSSQITAEFENGELVLHIPRSEESRARRIEIGEGRSGKSSESSKEQPATH